MKGESGRFLKRFVFVATGVTIAYLGSELLGSPGVWFRESAPWQSKVGQMTLALTAIVMMMSGIESAWLGLRGLQSRYVTLAGMFIFVSIFVVQCVAYPNVGLPFGYWVYPNRAIAAFLECPNVHSAKVGLVNHDFDLEEFEIIVEYSGGDGIATKHIWFPQYPDRREIVAHVAAIGCRL